MRYSDEFSTFRSAIEWPDMRPPSEVPTGEFMPLSVGLARTLDTIAIAHALAPKCESPIEVDFGTRMIKVLRVIDDDTLSLASQYSIGPFRYDFAITREGRPQPVILVECDGREFHQSKEQLANDRLKDALARNLRIDLLRFSGSEIYSSLDECITRVLYWMRLKGHLSLEQCEGLEHAGIRRHPARS
jgi:very-short-patch-repair endonuclease